MLVSLFLKSRSSACPFHPKTTDISLKLSSRPTSVVRKIFKYWALHLQLPRTSELCLYLQFEIGQDDQFLQRLSWQSHHAAGSTPRGRLFHRGLPSASGSPYLLRRPPPTSGGLPPAHGHLPCKMPTVDTAPRSLTLRMLNKEPMPHQDHIHVWTQSCMEQKRFLFH